MLPIHERLMEHEDAGPLLEPVDPIALQIPVCMMRTRNVAAGSHGTVVAL
jgi:hypothetical protein